MHPAVSGDKNIKNIYLILIFPKSLARSRPLTYIVIFQRTYYYAAWHKFTTVFAAVIRAIVSSNVFPAADIEEADLCSASPMPPDEIAKLFRLLLSTRKVY